MLGFDAAAGGGVDGRSVMVILRWCIEDFSLSQRLDLPVSRYLECF